SFFFQAEDGIRDRNVTGVQTCALPISIVPAETLIMALKNRKMNCPPKPTAATAAGASDPRDPTMITSTVVVSVWSKSATMTGHASEERRVGKEGMVGWWGGEGGEGGWA